MENKILEILQEVAMGAKTAFAAKRRDYDFGWRFRLSFLVR